MNIDLKWGLPFVLPFVLFAFLHIFFWISGISSDVDSASIAILSLFVGSFTGACMAIGMDVQNIKWNVRIGTKWDDV